ncbi:YdiU family protein [Actinoplanes sp. GCM10030250]|uniref:protein adenylyltransferase SelO n=1 Tax=Actinoplanes sp. GCM10030250 TaxID=3273376 RepID=UPI0036200B39
MNFDDRFARELPELAVPWQAEKFPSPALLVLDDKLAAELGFDPSELRQSGDTEQPRQSGGTEQPRQSGGVEQLLASPHSVAQAYAGHQFGGYSPRLGDGRALLLGEIDGRDVHLKGSGRTPFARGGDGLAAVGPMLREYVISHAMHALGIPTTRSLAVLATGGTVHRETPLPGAVLVRVAASHLRVGTFQYARATGDLGLLRRLADHAMARHYPEAAGPLAFFDSVVTAQASLIAKWMLAGFIHGVMNTDNMTISGETIDYGPCAFLDAFDPATVFSSIDHSGRYAYRNQPVVATWNLARLGEALLPLFSDDEDKAVALATEVLERFKPRYQQAWTTGMLNKIGLDKDGEQEGELLDDLVAFMQEERVDHTSFFRTLASSARGNAASPAPAAWMSRWLAHSPDPDAMDRVNPVYIPRNHLVEEALAAATSGDLDPVHRLLGAVTDPFTERAGLERYAEPAPKEFRDGFQTFCGT